jgi:tryptophan 2,3-dioxygenase
MGTPLSDYEKYIRTEELLALQKPADQRSHPDELQFQTVHQVAELWMKLAVNEADRAAAEMKLGAFAKATRMLQRVGQLQRLLYDQLALLDTMAPSDYMTIRNALGRGSGQESPGFKAICRMPERLWPAFEAALSGRKLSLRAIYQTPDEHTEAYVLAEAMIDLDQALQLWRERHLKLVYRQIGAGTPSLKGKPSELLAEGMRHRFFPKLWEIRDELFAEWAKAHPTGAEYGYHG